jgi:hypothetical protein
MGLTEWFQSIRSMWQPSNLTGSTFWGGTFEESRRSIEGREAWRAYNGELPPPLKIKKDEPDDNVQAGFAELIVDKGAEYLFGDDLKISTGNARADAFLAEVWPEEQRGVDLFQLAVNGGVFGHAWARIVLEDGKPRVQVGDPLNWAAEFPAEDFSKPRAYAHTFELETVAAGDVKIVQERYERLDGGGWSIQRVGIDPKGKRVEEGDPLTWNYSFCPVMQAQNLIMPNAFYGRADLSPQVLKLIKALHRLDSMLVRATRIHAWPKTIAKKMAVQDLKIGIGGVAFVGDGEIENLETNAEGLRYGEERRAKLREELFALTEIPEIVTGKLENVGQLSGVALQILYGPVIRRTERKRRTYGRLVRHLVDGLLEIGGITGAKVELHWGEIVPRNVAEQMSAATIKANLGVSRATLLSELGYDPVKEEEKKALEDAAARETLAQNANFQ